MEKIKRIAVLTLLSALPLAGCAFNTIKEKMNPMVGQPISVVTAKLGFPSDQRTIAGKKVYVWSTSNFVEGTNYKCEIRVIVDEHDMIIHWDSDGNLGGCERFASRLGYF